MLLEHLLRLVEEDARLAARRVPRVRARRLRAEEHAALRQQHAHERGEERHAARGPEERAPADGDGGYEEEVDDRRDEVPRAIS